MEQQCCKVASNNSHTERPHKCHGLRWFDSISSDLLTSCVAPLLTLNASPLLSLVACAAHTITTVPAQQHYRYS